MTHEIAQRPWRHPATKERGHSPHVMAMGKGNTAMHDFDPIEAAMRYHA
jgi:hypothetical protein